MRLGALIGQMDFQPFVEKREFAQPSREDIELKLGRDGKYFGIRQKCDQGAGILFVLDFANDFEFASRFAAGKSDQIDFAVPGNLGFEPFRQSIDALRADTVQTAGELVGSLTELTAGMQVGEYQLDGRHLKFRMHLDRNPASVVTNRNRAIDVNRDVDLCAETGQMLVDRVVQDLKDAVMKSALIRIPDIHPGPFPNGL